MRVAVITDTHFGARGDSPAFLEYFRRFYAEQFFPTLEDEKIDAVVHLGDLVDRRKYVNFNSARVMRECFLEPLSEFARRGDRPVYVVCGNHDTFYKNTNRVNSLDELARDYGFETVIHEPRGVFDGKMLLVPWICDDNREACAKAVKKSRAPICAGHFEIAGFDMSRGRPAEHGLSPKDFDHFRLVMSGHFHHKSSKGAIHYLGAPYEMTWDDYADPRGFHVLDLDSEQLEFRQNPLTMFAKVHFDGEKKRNEVPDVSGKIVKLIVRNRPDTDAFDLFVQQMAADSQDLQTVDDHMNADLLSQDDVVEMSDDTREILRRAVEDVDFDAKTELESLLVSLYEEAVSLES